MVESAPRGLVTRWCIETPPVPGAELLRFFWNLVSGYGDLYNIGTKIYTQDGADTIFIVGIVLGAVLLLSLLFASIATSGKSLPHDPILNAALSTCTANVTRLSSELEKARAAAISRDMRELAKFKRLENSWTFWVLRQAPNYRGWDRSRVVDALLTDTDHTIANGVLITLALSALGVSVFMLVALILYGCLAGCRRILKWCVVGS